MAFELLERKKNELRLRFEEKASSALIRINGVEKVCQDIFFLFPRNDLPSNPVFALLDGVQK